MTVAPASNIYSAEQFKLFSITINAERYTRPVVLFSSSEAAPGGAAIEFNIFEHINQPFLTGNLIMMDDADFYTAGDIQGTERVTIEYGLPTDEAAPVTLNMMIVNVERSIKTNDQTAILKFNLIQDLGWYDAISEYSKAYTGSGETIIENIVKDKFNLPLNKRITESQQGTFKYIVPYVTPSKAIKSILNKMTTQNGLPYFFFSTVGSNSFILKDMETIFQEESFNKDQPFVYSQATTNQATDITGQIRSIHNYEGNDLEDTLMLAAEGAIGSEYNYVNLTTGQMYTNTVDATSIVRDLVNYNIISREESVPMVDYNFIPDPSGTDPRTVNQYPARHFFQIAAENYPNDTGVNSYSQETHFSDAQLRVNKYAMLRHLAKNIYTIYLPGLLFLTGNEKTSVGSKISIQVLRNAIVEDPSSQNLIDQKRSGEFLIMAKRHIFDVQGGIHNVSMDVARMTYTEVDQ